MNRKTYNLARMNMILHGVHYRKFDIKQEDNDILFMDASQHFEKVKTQNILRGSNIDTIIDAFRNRKELDKYSKRASLQLIAENDYNLNIPRYVDTFEAEDSIAVNAIAQQIKDLDAGLAETDRTIAAFCRELNIETPF